MPARRPHSKSRLGCKECKLRRVKCDERHPICQNCERRDFDCSFQYGFPPPKKLVRLPESQLDLATGQSISPGSDLLSPHSDGNGAYPFTSTELLLIHQWSVESYKALSQRALEFHRMQVEIPKLALKHDFLLNTLFSLTSLHMAALHPDEARRYGDMAMMYQDRVTTRFHSVLAAPSAEQGPAMFWASIMISVTTFAMPQVYPDATHASPTETLIRMARLTMGTAAVIELAKRIMGEEAWFQEFPNIKPYEFAVDADVQEKLQDLKRLAAVADESFYDVPDDCLRPLRNYSFAANLFDYRFAIIPHDISPILALPVTMGSAVIDRLEAGDALARLIFLYYGLLLYYHDSKWWAAGSAKALVGELAPMLMASNPEWFDIIDWICGRVDLETPL